MRIPGGKVCMMQAFRYLSLSQFIFLIPYIDIFNIYIPGMESKNELLIQVKIRTAVSCAGHADCDRPGGHGCFAVDGRRRLYGGDALPGRVGQF